MTALREFFDDRPRPLLLYLDPVDGETLRSYLGRLAALHDGTPADIVGEISPRWRHRLQRLEDVHSLGVAMTTRTKEALAARLNLLPTQIEQLLFSDDSRTIRLRRGDDSLFDPAVGHATAEALLSRTWLAPVRQRRWCAKCITDVPGLELRDWCRPWVLACTKHRLPLHPYPLNLGAPQEWDEFLAVQEELLRIAHGEAEFVHVPPSEGFAELRAVWSVLALPGHRGKARQAVPDDVRDLMVGVRVLSDPADTWPPELRTAKLVMALERCGAVNPFGVAGRLANACGKFPGAFKLTDSVNACLEGQEMLLAPSDRRRLMRMLRSILPLRDLIEPRLSDYTPDLPWSDIWSAARELARRLLEPSRVLRIDDIGLSLRRVMWVVTAQGRWDDYCESTRGLLRDLLAGHGGVDLSGEMPDAQRLRKVEAPRRLEPRTPITIAAQADSAPRRSASTGT